MLLSAAASTQFSFNLHCSWKHFSSSCACGLVDAFLINSLVNKKLFSLHLQKCCSAESDLTRRTVKRNRHTHWSTDLKSSLFGYKFAGESFIITPLLLQLAWPLDSLLQFISDPCIQLNHFNSDLLDRLYLLKSNS